MKVFVNMGNVWDRATEFLSDNLGAILPIALLAIFLPMAVQSSIAPLAAQSTSTGLIVQVISLAGTILSLWGQLTILALAIDPLAGRAAATDAATRRLVPAIGVSLLVMIAAFALFLPIPLAMGFSGFDVQAAMNGDDVQMSTGLSVFVWLYALVLIPLFVALAARLALYLPVVVKERRGAAALRRSLVLTRGLAWKIIGVMLLFLIVFGVAVLAAQTVFGSLLQLVAGGEGPISAATVLTAILVALVSTGFVLLLTAFSAKLYLAVRDAREAIVDSK